MENIHVILIIFLIIFMCKKSKSKENFTGDISNNELIGNYTVDELASMKDNTLADSFWENTNQYLGRPCIVERDSNGVIFSMDCNNDTYCDGIIDIDGGAGHCNYRTMQPPCVWADLVNEEDPCPEGKFCNQTDTCQSI